MRDGDLASSSRPGADKKVRAELDRRFRSLRAMKVAEFEMTIDSGPFNEKKVGGFSRVGRQHSDPALLRRRRLRAGHVLVDTAWRDSAGRLPAGEVLDDQGRETGRSRGS